MERFNKILKNQKFLDNLEYIRKAEKTRVYCGHDINHLFDTARICYIINLEENLGFDKEIIYSMTILHDIGRSEQYKNNTPHDIAGVNIATDILLECGFSNQEIDTITNAISGHRQNQNTKSLQNLLYRADKLSRLCFSCGAEKSCYWDKDKKNFDINY